MRLNWKGALFALIVIASWQAISTFGAFNVSLFPGPIKVFQTGVALLLSGELTSDILVSTWRVLLGLGIGSGAGVFLGLVMGRTIWAEETAAPFLHIVRALPPVAIIPLMIVWFGIGDSAKIIEIAFAVFFPVWISTLIGAKSIPSTYLRTAKVFLKSTPKKITRVLVPAVTPFIINGVRIGVAIAFIMVFVSELAGASSGLGYLIAYAQMIYRADIMIVGLIVLGLLAATVDFVFVLAVTKAFPWVNKNGE